MESEDSSGAWALFRNGHFTDLQVILEEQLRTCSGGTIHALKLRNNVTVCKMMTYSKEDRANHLAVLYEILQTCHSVPVTEEMVCTELLVLYNYLYAMNVLSEAGKRPVDDESYKTVNRTLYRVCKLLAVSGSDLSYAARLPSRECFNKLVGMGLSYLQCRGFDRVTAALCMCVNTMSWIHINQDIDSSHGLEKSRLAQDFIDATGTKDTIESEEVLVLPVQADQHDLALTPAVHKDWTLFLQAACLYRSKLWSDCHKCLQNIKDSSVQVVANFLSGWALYKGSQYLESVALMMETLRSQQPVTQRLKARIYSLIGLCFSELDKAQLAIQMYKEALSADFGFLLPLYRTSEQYRKLGQGDKELECLNLLITAIEMREPSDPAMKRLELLELLDLDDRDVPYPMVLYSMASRAFALHKYEESAERFTQLVSYLKSWQAEAEAFKCLPPVEQIYKEAVESLLKSERYSECVSMCDTVLLTNCGQNSVFDSSMLNDSSLVNSSALSTTNKDDSITMMLLEEDSQGGSVSKKRKFSDSQCLKGSGLHESTYTEVMTLKMKAEALVKLGDDARALSCLERATDTVTKYRRCLLQTHTQDQPASKRRKVESVSCSVYKDVTSEKTFDIEGDIYTLTANILIAQKQHQEAQHFQRLAAQLTAASTRTGVSTWTQQSLAMVETVNSIINRADPDQTASTGAI